MFANAEAGRAHHAEGMRFVHHQECLVAALDVDEARQLGEIAVHAVNAFDDDQHALELAPLLGQHRIERGPVVVREGQTPRARELNALQRAVVDQLVVHDQVPRSEQIADGGDIGGVAADEHHGIVHAVGAGDGRFQLAMQRTLAGHRAAGRHRRAVAVDGVPWQPPKLADARTGRGSYSSRNSSTRGRRCGCGRRRCPRDS